MVMKSPMLYLTLCIMLENSHQMENIFLIKTNVLDQAEQEKKELDLFSFHDERVTICTRG